MVERVCGDRAAGQKIHYDLFFETLDNDGVGDATVGGAVIPQRLL